MDLETIELTNIYCESNIEFAEKIIPLIDELNINRAQFVSALQNCLSAGMFNLGLKVQWESGIPRPEARRKFRRDAIIELERVVNERRERRGKVVISELSDTEFALEYIDQDGCECHYSVEKVGSDWLRIFENCPDADGALRLEPEVAAALWPILKRYAETGELLESADS
jgi:hypothetical protein